MEIKWKTSMVLFFKEGFIVNFIKNSKFNNLSKGALKRSLVVSCTLPLSFHILFEVKICWYSSGPLHTGHVFNIGETY